VVAFIDHHMHVVRDQIGHDAFADHTLQQRDIDDAAGCLLPAIDDANLGRRDVQEGVEPRDPLVEQLAVMDQYQGVPVARRDQLRRDDGLAKRRGRGEHAGVALEEMCGRHVLLRHQLAQESRPDERPLLALIAHARGDIEIGEEAQHIVETACGSATCLENSSVQEWYPGSGRSDRRSRSRCPGSDSHRRGDKQRAQAARIVRQHRLGEEDLDVGAGARALDG